MFRRLTIAIILIIAAISTSSCHVSKSEDERSVLLARETILRDNLYHLRKSIDLYTADHNALPQSLDDLVKAGYVREIPTDPITNRKDWKLIMEDDANKGKSGIADVKSASTAKSSEGTLYSDW
jgi:general secretion pathway protein G